MRSFPHTTAEALSSLGYAAVTLTVAVVSAALCMSYFDKRWRTKQARLVADSAAFCARWSRASLWSVPYAELADEVARCRQIIRLLQLRNLYLHRNGMLGDSSIAIGLAIVETWLRAVHSAMVIAGGETGGAAAGAPRPRFDPRAQRA